MRERKRERERERGRGREIRKFGCSCDGSNRRPGGTDRKEENPRDTQRDREPVRIDRSEDGEHGRESTDSYQRVWECPEDITSVGPSGRWVCDSAQRENLEIDSAPRQAMQRVREADVLTGGSGPNVPGRLLLEFSTPRATCHHRWEDQPRSRRMRGENRYLKLSGPLAPLGMQGRRSPVETRLAMQMFDRCWIDASFLVRIPNGMGAAQSGTEE